MNANYFASPSKPCGMSPASLKTSKFLSLVLRHQPEVIGLTLDAQGWADVADLSARANANGVALDEGTLVEIVATSDKKRFALSGDGRHIRDSQGHSLDIALELQAVVPPDLLFHGTAARFLSSIRAQGLVPGSRQYVHHSGDRTAAHKVGSRHGPPVVLRVRAGAMAAGGHLFYCSENGVWLAHAVPAAFIGFDEAP